jgi:hypothetical protein
MGQHITKNRVAVTDVAICRVRERAKGFRVFLILLENLRDLPGLRVARGREKHRVKQAENTGVNADSEGQNQHGRERKTGRLPELSKSKPPIRYHDGEMRLMGWSDSENMANGGKRNPECNHLIACSGGL